MIFALHIVKGKHQSLVALTQTQRQRHAARLRSPVTTHSDGQKPKLHLGGGDAKMIQALKTKGTALPTPLLSGPELGFSPGSVLEVGSFPRQTLRDSSDYRWIFSNPEDTCGRGALTCGFEAVVPGTMILGKLTQAAGEALQGRGMAYHVSSEHRFRNRGQIIV